VINMSDSELHKLIEKLYLMMTHPIFAGFLGSIFSLKFVPGKTFLGRSFNLTMAFAIVWYGSPAVIDLFNIRTESMAGLMSFVIGLFGVNLASQISIGIKRTEFAAIFTSYLTVFAEYFRKR